MSSSLDPMDCIACQVPLSSAIFRSLLKFMSIESVMLSNHIILCRLHLLCFQSFPSSGSVQLSQLFVSGGQSIGASASASVLPMSIQGWFLLGLTGLISLQSKGISRVFFQNHSSKASIFQHSAFFTVQLSHPCMITRKTIALTRQTFVSKWCLCFSVCCLGLS